MSGIFGFINFDGTPIDRSILERMKDRVTPLGPDEQNLYIHENVGFGHTLSRILNESAREHQPLVWDEVVITAYARLDDRSGLISALKSAGRDVHSDDPDVDLILHAYFVWGRQCVAHLSGDFVFAIWDGRQQQFFAARDQMGTHPFNYAFVENTLIFSNEMMAIRQHPAVSMKLDEYAIADFLLFGGFFWFDRRLTIFSDIRMLEAAHQLTADHGSVQTERYWQLPYDEPMLRYRTEQEYADHFLDLFKITLKDRARTDRVVVSMSGGLDSTSIAAMLSQLVQQGEITTQVSAVVGEVLAHSRVDIVCLDRETTLGKESRVDPRSRAEVEQRCARRSNAQHELSEGRACPAIRGHRGDLPYVLRACGRSAQVLEFRIGHCGGQHVGAAAVWAVDGTRRHMK